MPPQLLTETVICCVEPHDGLAETAMIKTPRLPPPRLVVTEITLDPFPSIRCSDTPMTKLFPLPVCVALIVRTPVAFVIVNVAVPVCLSVLLWLNSRWFGLMDEEHC